jgi:hypothetical protein
MPNPQNNPYLMSEADIPENWHPIETEPTVPGASPAAYAATPSMPPYYRGSIDSNLEHDAQFVATDRTPRVTSIPLMPVAPSGNPQTNAAIQSIIKINQSSSVVASSGVIFRGVWNPLTAYTIGNIVTYNGSSYIAITGSVNSIPWSNATNWALLGKNLNFRGLWSSVQTVRQNAPVNYTSNGTPTSVTFASNILAGSHIVVSTFVKNIGASTVPVVTDSQGNLYTLVVAGGRIDSNEYQMQTWITLARMAGPCTVTVTWTGGTTPGTGGVLATEITGLVASPVGASTHTEQKIGGALPMTLTVLAGQMIYTCATVDNSPITAPTGYLSFTDAGNETSSAWNTSPAVGSDTVTWVTAVNRFMATAVALTLSTTSFNYNPYDVVEFNGSMWLAVAATNGSPISDSTSWTLFAQATGLAQVKTANYLAVAGDEGTLLSFNISGPGTLTLPSTPPDSGWYIFVQNLSSGTLTVSPNGLNIDGSSSSLTLAQFSGMLIFTDGTSYFTEHDLTSIVVPNIFTLSVSSSGIATIGIANENANTFFAGPTSGGPAPAAFRSLVSADLPPGTISFPSLLQSNSNSSGGSASNTLNIAFSLNNIAGDFLVIGVRWATSTSGQVTYTVTDSQGNTWIKVPSTIFNSPHDTVDIWYVFNCKAGANTVTLTYVSGGGGAGTNFPRGVIAEFSGMPFPTSFDKSNSATGNSTAANSGSITPTQAFELLIGFNANEDADNITNTPSAGWTTIKIQDGNETLAYQIVQAANSYNYSATLSSSVHWAAYIASFSVIFLIPKYSLFKGTAAGDYSSASTTYAAVDGTNLSQTITIPLGWKLVVEACGNISSLTAAAGVNVALLDGSTVLQAEKSIVPIAVGDWTPFSLKWVITGDGLSHTIQLQYLTSNALDSVTIQNNNTGTNSNIPVMITTLTPSN